VTGELASWPCTGCWTGSSRSGSTLIDVHPIHDAPPACPSAGGTGEIGGRSVLYRITVSGHLSRQLRAVFEDLLVRERHGVTELAGPLDQAALFVVLHRIRVRSLSRVDVSQDPPGAAASATTSIDRVASAG